MAMHMATLFLAFAAFAACEGEHVSPVQKTMTLLDDMLVKTKSEIDELAADYKEFALFCDRTTREKKLGLTRSAEAIASLDATVLDTSAEIDAYGMKIADVSLKVAAVDGELHSATVVRKKEEEGFLNVEKELTEAVKQIRTITESGKVALAQLTPDDKRHLAAVMVGLRHIVEAGFVTQAHGAKLASFLQSQEDAEDGLSVKAPTADTLTRVVDMAESALRGARNSEHQAQNAHALLKQNLDDEIANMNSQISESTHAKQVSEEGRAQAKKDLALETAEHSADDAFTENLGRDCSSKAQVFEVEYRDASKALKALNNAKVILADKFAALIETGVVRESGSLDQVQPATEAAVNDGKTRALRIIQQLGKRLHSSALISLSYRASANPFSKVRSMVEDMIAKLQHDAAEDATQENFCNEEQAKTKKSQAGKELDLDKTEARMEKAGSAVEMLTEQIASLSEEIAVSDAMWTEATTMRTKENAHFKKMESDLVTSVWACGAAISALREYYSSGAALLQLRAEVREFASQKAKAKDVEGILQVLQFAESDFQAQLSEHRADEKVAARQYEKLRTETEQDRATKMTVMKAKQSEVKSLKSALRNYGEDKQSLDTELDALVEYLADLKPRCEQAPASYVERKAVRAQEIEGLRDALKLLE